MVLRSRADRYQDSHAVAADAVLVAEVADTTAITSAATTDPPDPYTTGST
jgi:hypothetical protein